jgi:predicted small lipoprotein YifL
MKVKLILLILLANLVASCGRSGALQLPEEPQQENNQQQDEAK